MHGRPMQGNPEKQGRQPWGVRAAEEVDAGLRALSNPERAVQEKRYLKSGLEHLGASVPATRKVVKRCLSRWPELGRNELLSVVAELWGHGVHEHRMAAAELLDLRSDLLEPGDLPLLERFLRESRTWALVDNLSVHVVGELVERQPDLGAVLDRWAEDGDFWIRRASLLALLLPLRRGEGDFDRFTRYADAMLEEKEFFIRKAIGWVLRETGKRRPGLVAEWLAPRAARASGLTVREAVRRLTPELRDRVLAGKAH